MRAGSHDGLAARRRQRAETKNFRKKLLQFFSRRVQMSLNTGSNHVGWLS
jgi:hypothetical protein